MITIKITGDVGAGKTRLGTALVGLISRVTEPDDKMWFEPDDDNPNTPCTYEISMTNPEGFIQLLGDIFDNNPPHNLDRVRQLFHDYLGVADHIERARRKAVVQFLCRVFGVPKIAELSGDQIDPAIMLLEYFKAGWRLPPGQFPGADTETGRKVPPMDTTYPKSAVPEFSAMLEPGERIRAAMDVDGYEGLARVLQLAFDQSARGKGRERHAKDKPFNQQPIMEIGRMLGSTCDGEIYQICKKAQEASGMLSRGKPDAAKAELLGVIVYAAASYLLIEETT